MYDPASESNQPAEKQKGCGCGGFRTGISHLNRREFLRVAGLGVLATSLGRPNIAMAGPFDSAAAASHPVPVDKKLDPEWVKQLYARGNKEVYRGADLESIGMPCGGIGSGQMYLNGDGTLGCWQIFNNAESMWIGSTGSTYERRIAKRPFYQEFALLSRQKGKAAQRRLLNRDGWRDITFKGEYPIGRVTYADPDSELSVSLEAFSPFIPLNAADSALPATLFYYTVENKGSVTAEVSIVGLLENSVGFRQGSAFKAERTFRYERGKDRTRVVLSAEEPPKPADTPPEYLRDPILFADFEGNNYGDWTIEGKAFGKGPAEGALPGQQKVSGYEGKKLVNSFVGGDIATGRLISPSFTISRRCINFLIGGGNQAGKTELQLVVDGRIIYTATGLNQEQLIWQHWNVEKLEGKQAQLIIVDAADGGWGHINIDHIEFADATHSGEKPTFHTMPDYGALCLSLGDTASMPMESWMAELLEAGDRPSSLAFVMEDHVCDIAERKAAVLAAPAVSLKPGKKHTFLFSIAWYFPNQAEGQYYATLFPGVSAVSEYLFDHLERLAGDTRSWRDLYYDSTLPYWLLDRLHSTVSILASGTCQWWADGRFYAYEGVTCCPGTCTHVWNYSHAEARLFPELTRRVREMQDFRDRSDGGGYHPDSGLVGFRSDDNYAADGQCGTILKAYREHLMSADSAFLQRNWPRIRKAMEFSIGHDKDNNGLIEDSQHNTYDINFEGPNTFVGGLYLAALKACEAMATEMQDWSFAEKVRLIAEKGRKNSEERLWNGEYFIQEVDLAKHPKYQYKDGCLSDQLFGQGWMHQLDLGYIYDPAKVKAALQAIWKYNWAPDVAPFNEKFPPQRWFITPGHGGLFICTWPKSDHLREGVLYREEVWTGIEYQVAGHMIAEGMTDEALTICRAVHDRYQPALANPYNEVECGDHYARAMASWGVYLTLAGFAYHGPKGFLAFNPRISPEDYRALFTTAEGWILFSQSRKDTRQANRISVRWGRLALNTLRLGIPGDTVRRFEVTLNGKALSPRSEVSEHNQWRLHFSESPILEKGDVLEILSE